MGLLRAASRYDSRMGTPFWAYAAWWLRQAMKQLVSETTRPVVLPDRAQRRLGRLREARRRHLEADGVEPSLDELAAATGLDRYQVEDLLAVELVTEPATEEELGPGDGGSSSRCATSRESSTHASARPCSPITASDARRRRCSSWPRGSV